MFGEPDGRRPAPELWRRVLERVSWWAEVFERALRCLRAGSIDEIEALVEAGADFVALGDCALERPAQCRVPMSPAPCTHLRPAGGRCMMRMARSPWRTAFVCARRVRAYGRRSTAQPAPPKPSPPQTTVNNMLAIRDAPRRRLWRLSARLLPDRLH